MKSILVKSLFISSIANLLLLTAVSGQTYTAVVETNQVLSSTGSVVNYGGTIDGQALNVFHGVVSSATDLDALFDPLVAAGDISGLISALETISWNTMIDGTSFGGLQWYSGFSQPISVGQRPVVVFMNATDPSGLVAGSEFGLVQSISITSNLQNITTGFLQGSNSYTVVVGTSGSIQLTALVPEPGTYALFFGILGLGLVLWRRRR